MKPFVLAILLPNLAAAASAQGANVVVPAAFDGVEGAQSAALWRDGPNRVQAIYSAAQFIAHGIDHPIDVGRLRWRAGGGLAGAAGSFPFVEVWIGYSANAAHAPSATFAANRTPSHTLVHAGRVDFVAVVGGSPNGWHIDLPLASTFRYDPANGADLLVEFAIHSAPTVPPPPTSASFDVALHGASVVRSLGTITAPAGGTSAFAPVLELGFTEPPGLAKRGTYGNGCYAGAASFYERFAAGAFDLGGNIGVTNSVRLSPNAAGGYSVQSGSNAWFQPQTPPLPMSDDTVTGPIAIQGFAFSFPGGVTTALHVASNGFVWLTGPGSAAPSGSTAEFLAAGPRLAPYWTDLDPSPLTGGGSVHVDEDLAGGALYVTWNGVPMWDPAPAGARPLSHVQLALFSTGDVEFRWQDCQLPGFPIVTGFSRGNGAIDGGGFDVSTALPFSTEADRRPLTLEASARPLLGTTIALVTSGIPAAAVFNALWLSTNAVRPGLPLAFVGMPGCEALVVQQDVNLFFGTGTAAVQLTLPTGPSWIGTRIFGQSAALVPGVNPLGVLSSNGCSLVFGGL